MTGPFATIDVTTIVERTIKKTEQKARQKWHLCLLTSLHW